MKMHVLVLGACCSLFAVAIRRSPAQAALRWKQIPTIMGARADSSAGRALAGTYTLVSIDGNAVPVVPADRDAPANHAAPELLASTLVVRTDGSFVMAMSYRRTVAGAQQFFAQPFSGTCARVSDGFIARWDGAGETRLSLAGDTLVMENNGSRFAYRRRR